MPHGVWYCSSPAVSAEIAEPVGFQIYEETGLTPAPATRTAAVISDRFPSHAGKRTNDDKENQFVAIALAAAADDGYDGDEDGDADYVNPQADEEAMAVDFVNILFCLLTVTLLLNAELHLILSLRYELLDWFTTYGAIDWVTYCNM